jgi:hypothetical protein
MGSVDLRHRGRGRVDEAGGVAGLARLELEPRQSVIDVVGRRHGVERDIGMSKRQVLRAGRLRRDAARRRAVVDIDQAAMREFLQHRRQRRVRRRETRAHQVGDADIALHARHQPLQAVDVLRAGQRGQQGLRSGVVVGIIERLHRRLQQQLVAAGAGVGRDGDEVGAVGRERQRHRRRQGVDRLVGRRRADAEAADDQRDARRIDPAGRDRHRLRVGL